MQLFSSYSHEKLSVATCRHHMTEMHMSKDTVLWFLICLSLFCFSSTFLKHIKQITLNRDANVYMQSSVHLCWSWLICFHNGRFKRMDSNCEILIWMRIKSQLSWPAWCLFSQILKEKYVVTRPEMLICQACLFHRKFFYVLLHKSRTNLKFDQCRQCVTDLHIVTCTVLSSHLCQCLFFQHSIVSAHDRFQLCTIFVQLSCSIISCCHTDKEYSQYTTLISQWWLWI